MRYFIQLNDRALYADEIDYAQPVPSPPLRPADAAWATGRVRDWLAARHTVDE
jgi:hypothetical protein